MFDDIQFLHPALLWLLGLIPLLMLWYLRIFRKRRPVIKFFGTGWMGKSSRSLRSRLVHAPFVLRLLVLALLILAMARPQSSSKRQDVYMEGIDIMIALDISGSMLARDFRPDRLESAKQTALEFIDMRPHDRIGISVFSGQSFTLAPLTLDHYLLRELLPGVHTGMIEDGTAIGDGLATSINRLRESQALSHVVILLTDGINNSGMIDPLTAAEIAAMTGIRVYTIGVGSSGPVPYPFQTPLGIRLREVEIPVDEELLNQIAQMTGGRYFWADTRDALSLIYQEIDQLERSRIEVTEFTRRHDEYLPLLLLAMGIFVLELLLRHSWLRSLP